MELSELNSQVAKGFGCVDWTKLLEILRDISVNWRVRRLIRNLYVGERVKLPFYRGDTDSEEIGRGVRKGFYISPI